ncbi:MAG TPA: Rne/Rng family ribonuclease [Gaiellaceae bacterium]
MPWFRRRRKSEAEQAPVTAAAPPALPEVVIPAEPAAVETADPDAEAAKPKRRRGTRGGRGRKKPTEAGETAAKTGAAKAEQAEKPTARAKAKAKADKPEKKPERAVSQRRERAATRRRQPQRRAPLPAAKRELLVSVDVGEQRVAVLEDERVAEVYLERPERRSIAGNIYLGVVDNVLPGMEAAFVEIGLEKNGFLYVDEIVRSELEGSARQGKKIHELIQRGETILVQAVKDPMKTKGARLTMDVSLPGRFVVYQPTGDGVGVSRRLDDAERQRLKDILKALEVKQGGVIVRTAAEGASAEDIERDLVFLQRLWKTIQTRAKELKAPALVYQEAELPLRVTRDLFTGDFEKAYVDDDRAFKRIVGYLKKTSPHMVERVVRYKEKTPLMEAFGVDAEIKSTLSRRVDLPSGGYLIFDYAEAFTVIDVNTGRFVGGRGKSSNARLEDTITKNNLEAVKEVVRQLRLRDIGGIIVIDFIDMANPKNRAQVEEALRTELERDRTKTYVVEISPLGLVEMTRQNVTDGPREVMTRKCPTCGGDGIVVSEQSAAVEIERRLRALAAGSRSQAYRVEVAAKVASILIGPGASRLMELEAHSKRRFFLEPRADVHNDHFLVLAEGKLVDLAPEAPVAEGAEVELKLVEVALHDVNAAVGKVDGLDVCVGGAAGLVGKKTKVRIERVLDGTAYAALAETGGAAQPEPLTAEGEAEKPTRRPPARKAKPAAEATAVEEPAAVTVEEEPAAEAEELEPTDEEETEGGEAAPAKRRTRRGSRGGRKRRKKPAEGAEETPEDEEAEVAEAVEEPAAEAEPEVVAAEAEPSAVTIHLPDEDLGRDEEAEEGEGEAQAPKKRTRRGSRGGRRRRKPAGTNGTEPADDDAEPAAEEEATAAAEPETEPPEADSANGRSEDWEYVPMSEWVDEIEA